MPARLASYLLYLDEQQRGAGHLELDISKALLANVLGTIPETLSRIFAKLSAQSMIAVEGRTIRDAFGLSLSFAVDDFRRHCLLNGLDDIGLTLQYEEKIAAYEKARGIGV